MQQRAKSPPPQTGASSPVRIKGTHGGRRPGAGRKPKGDVAGVRHRPRGALDSRFPVHVTMKMLPGLPPLRQPTEYAALRAAFAAGSTGTETHGPFRLCHYAVRDDHLYFIVEAKDRTALTGSLQGLTIRIARGLNKLWGRRGKVFADRYEDRALRTPREVRDALRDVLAGGKRQASKGRARPAIDTYTSAPWFDGFREKVVVRGFATEARPVTDARTALLKTGWRRLGLLSVRELSAPPAR